MVRHRKTIGETGSAASIASSNSASFSNSDDDVEGNSSNNSCEVDGMTTTNRNAPRTPNSTRMVMEEENSQ